MRQGGLVYLIHFAKPYHHAQHYIGFVEHPEGLEARMEEHRRGRGARLMAAVTAAGIEWAVVRTWAPASRGDERRLKRQKHAWRHCPICRAERRVQKEVAAHAEESV